MHFARWRFKLKCKWNVLCSDCPSKWQMHATFQANKLRMALFTSAQAQRKAQCAVGPQERSDSGGGGLRIRRCRAVSTADWGNMFFKGFGGRMTLFLHLFFFLYNRYMHASFIHKHSLRPISMSSQLSAQWAGGTSMGYRAEIRSRACLTASLRTTNWATLHPKYG